MDWVCYPGEVEVGFAVLSTLYSSPNCDFLVTERRILLFSFKTIDTGCSRRRHRANKTFDSGKLDIALVILPLG